MQWAQSREDSSFTELLLCQYSRRGRSSSTSIPAICSNSYGSVPNIEEESYDTENSSASISLSSLRQHQRQPSRACAVRAGRPSEAVAGRARLPQLPAPAAPAHSRPSCQPASWLQKTPLGLESKQKQYSSKKPDKSSDT